MCPYYLVLYTIMQVYFALSALMALLAGLGTLMCLLTSGPYLELYITAHWAVFQLEMPELELRCDSKYRGTLTSQNTGVSTTNTNSTRILG